MESEYPRKMIQQQGTRTWGFMAWKSWLDLDNGMEFASRDGTYSWTRKGAERKTRRLLRRYLAQTPPTPPEEIQ